MHTPLWCWFATGVLILSLLAVDFAFHRRYHQITLHGALAVSAAWVGVSVLFGLAMGTTGNWESAGEFFGGYLTEKALSVDNIFVFALLFRAFDVPSSYQRRVLFYGVFGALVLRGALIAVGASLIDHFGWVLFVLGALLILAGSRMARGNDLIDPDRNFVVRGLRRLVPVTPDYVGSRFLARTHGKLMATPLLIALLAIEVTDLVFAMDSIPATFGITRDVFVVFTANAFAVLGLRALYFVLAGALDRFTYVKYGLAVLLVFIGLKMLLAPVLTLPILVSLAAIATIIGVSIAISLWHERRVSTGRKIEPELNAAFKAGSSGRLPTPACCHPEPSMGPQLESLRPFGPNNYPDNAGRSSSGKGREPRDTGGSSVVMVGRPGVHQVSDEHAGDHEAPPLRSARDPRLQSPRPLRSLPTTRVPRTLPELDSS